VASDFDEENLHLACLRMSLYHISGYGCSEFFGGGEEHPNVWPS